MAVVAAPASIIEVLDSVGAFMGLAPARYPVVPEVQPVSLPAIGGSVMSFRAVFETEFAYVWKTLRRLGVQSADLADVTQETFLKVHAAFDNYDPLRPLRPWLFAFAVRVAADYRRLARHRELLHQGDALAETTADTGTRPDEKIENRESLELVSRALDALSFDRRAAFVLHVIDECPIPVVAETLNIPLNTAYSRLRLAREDFTAAFQRVQRREKQS